MVNNLKIGSVVSSCLSKAATPIVSPSESTIGSVLVIFVHVHAYINGRPPKKITSTKVQDNYIYHMKEHLI